MQKRALPAIVHKGFKVLSNTPLLVYYLVEQFPEEVARTGHWPAEHSKELQNYLEWYQNNLRPSMKEFYAFIVAKHKAGLDKPPAALEDSGALSDVQSVSSGAGKQPSSQDLEKMSANEQLLHQANEDYLNKFKFVCRQMEQKFFVSKAEGPYIFGTKPTCFDHILY